MPILEVLLVMIVIAFLVYASERWIPKPSPGWNTAIRWVAIIGIVIWLTFMLWPMLSGLMSHGPRLPRG